jgi:hypothetical protein
LVWNVVRLSYGFVCRGYYAIAGSKIGKVHVVEQAWWRQRFDIWKEMLFHLAQKNILHSLHYTYTQLSVMQFPV